ncbi:heparan-alpha-glucosaminide N-acetyltransferase domain-containing protein [Streptomyces coacervatus]|uniref:Heparan-alpha-glucosaminide N-acetyltransferase domain-containing protein n=2 Tax=Streptomyces coacervatus TaxID=647381 RepID=A0ABP7I0U5_9ACTN
MPSFGAESPIRESNEPRTATPGVGRLIGVDLARGLAVFGMYAAHVGPDPSEGGVTGFLMELAHGRSSALFAFLAGFAIVLITGRSAPKTGRAGRQAAAKVVIRAVILLALGTALTMSGTPVEVILAFYGVYFLFVLPLYRLSAGALAVTAAGTALVLPQVLYVVKPALGDGGFPSPGEPDGLLSLLFTGSYPALTWVPFVIAGMAVARLDLAATAVRLRLALTGVVLAVIGYGGSWLALHLVPGALSALSASGWGGNPASAWWSDTAGYPFGDTPYWLLAASPHSETTLSILGNTGVAITVVTACLAAMDHLPRLRRLARPVIAVGSMSLTAYVFHIVGIRFLGIEELPGSPLHVLLGFIAAVAVFATLWSRYVSRGPLEWLMAKATGIARHVR